MYGTGNRSKRTNRAQFRSDKGLLPGARGLIGRCALVHHADGRRLSVAFTVALLVRPDGAVAVIAAVLRDEARRRAEEEALCTELAELSDAADAGPSHRLEDTSDVEGRTRRERRPTWSGPGAWTLGDGDRDVGGDTRSEGHGRQHRDFDQRRPCRTTSGGLAQAGVRSVVHVTGQRGRNSAGSVVRTTVADDIHQ